MSKKAKNFDAETQIARHTVGYRQACILESIKNDLLAVSTGYSPRLWPEDRTDRRP